MDAERARAFFLTLPHVVETQQWGDKLVFWAGDKAIGGKMFALVDLTAEKRHGVISFAAGAERFAELLECEGLRPAPYLARAFWISAERWDALRNAEWKELFTAAHALVYAKLPPRVRSVFLLPKRKLAALVTEQRALRADKPKAKRQTTRRAKPAA